MGLFSKLFSKGDPDTIVKKGGKYYCPACGADLDPIIANQANSMYSIYSRMGPIAGPVTMDMVKQQIYDLQGVQCTCGKFAKPRKKK